MKNPATALHTARLHPLFSSCNVPRLTWDQQHFHKQPKNAHSSDTRLSQVHFTAWTETLKHYMRTATVTLHHCRLRNNKEKKFTVHIKIQTHDLRINQLSVLPSVLIGNVSLHYLSVHDNLRSQNCRQAQIKAIWLTHWYGIFKIHSKFEGNRPYNEQETKKKERTNKLENQRRPCIQVVR